ncbi:MAG TPA: DUF4349 domain-containing protein, partial [Pyrinomonadaceae bacterium]|nr:DUF4349 domain-containing protein [Pyrinomonadaceae bacterium]
MRMLTTLTLTAALLALSACSQARMSQDSVSLPRTSDAPQASVSTATQTTNIPVTDKGSVGRVDGPTEQYASLNQAEASQNVAAVSHRKIIRNATLSIEIDAPANGQRRIASIAEARGGFVVTSESQQQGGASGESKSYEVVTIEVRVPAAEFDAVVNEIRAVGGRVKEEKITGQDVTEEYI